MGLRKCVFVNREVCGIDEHGELVCVKWLRCLDLLATTCSLDLFSLILYALLTIELRQL